MKLIVRDCTEHVSGNWLIVLEHIGTGGQTTQYHKRITPDMARGLSAEQVIALAAARVRDAAAEWDGVPQETQHAEVIGRVLDVTIEAVKEVTKEQTL